MSEDNLETTIAEGEMGTKLENTGTPQTSNESPSEGTAEESEDHTSKNGSAEDNPENQAEENIEDVTTTKSKEGQADVSGDIGTTSDEKEKNNVGVSTDTSNESEGDLKPEGQQEAVSKEETSVEANEENEKAKNTLKEEETNREETSENAGGTLHEKEDQKKSKEPTILSEEQETSINSELSSYENQPQVATEKEINNVETGGTEEISRKIEDVAHKHTQISSHLKFSSTTEIDIGLVGFGSTPCEYCHSAKNKAIVTSTKTNGEAEITSEVVPNGMQTTTNKPIVTENAKTKHPTTENETETKEVEPSEIKEKNEMKENKSHKEDKEDEDMKKEDNQKEKEKESEVASTTKIESHEKDTEKEEKEKQHPNDKEEEDREKENNNELEKSEEVPISKTNTKNDDNKKDETTETEEVFTSESKMDKEKTINQNQTEEKEQKEEEEKDKTTEISEKNDAKGTEESPKTKNKTEKGKYKATEEVSGKEEIVNKNKNEEVEKTNTITEEGEETRVTQSFELTHNKENEFSESGKNRSQKPVVIIVNNTGNKLRNLNQTVLENILSTSLPDVDLHYIDVDVEENETFKHTMDKNTPLKLNIKYESCKKDDYVLGKHCLCNIQTYLNTLSDKITHKEIIKPKENYCKSYIKFNNGLPLENNIKPVERKRRSLIYLESLKRKGEHIEHDNMANLFENEYRLNTSESNMFCLPGENVKIVCTSSTKNISNNDKGMIWKFHPVSSTKEEELLEKGTYLMLHGVSFKHAGNYTCTKEDEKDDPDKIHWHELEMITFPIYEININIFYKINDTCNLKTGDILHSYLPKIVGPILCSNDNDACSIDLPRPRCLTRSDDNYYNVTINAKIGPEFINSLPENCDINCKLMAHQNMVNIIYKNSEVLEGIPVYSKIEPSHTIEFLPNINGKEGSPVIVRPPKINVFCQGGFGLESKMQSVCVACPPNTFSSDDVAFCIGCPAGQYQPDVGSKSCLSCNSPVDDKMCLRMLYTDTKLFKLYAGIAFGFVVLLIIIMIVWITGPKENEKIKSTFEGSLKHRAASRKKTSDIESGVRAPLLGQSPRKPTPPQLPPLDF